MQVDVYEQSLHLATDIHTQWGSLFMFGCAFRLLSYLMALLGPVPKSLTEPSRPFSELLVSFALLCGGLIFMESTEPVVQIFEFRGYTSMFTLSVSLGLVTLFMGYQMSLMSLRDSLRRRISFY
ncbi:uncharacterized protein PRCAT00005790001 [Priceomyces carsonii]|uniref:uncharacterized protein n=1 Tax=Priceomyces carsonii TaxID=28549 RepID=UPI002ED8C682|nr:unnamed protein product [Priceomyces carsonii]